MRAGLRLSGCRRHAAQQIHGRRSVSACVCAVPVAAALLEQDRAEEAAEMLACWLDLAHHSSPDVMIVATLCQARLQWLAGDRHGARATLIKRRPERRAGADTGAGAFAGAAVLFAIQAGDLRHAGLLQDELDALAATLDASDMRPGGRHDRGVVARARGAGAGNPVGALAALEPVRSDNAGALGPIVCCSRV
jgi:LuxR family maltose regulon positive regulatory protein